MFERTYVNQSVKVSESLSEVNLHSQKSETVTEQKQNSLSQKEKKTQKRKCKSKSEFRSPNSEEHKLKKKVRDNAVNTQYP